ncbi:hypothetical protein HWV62_18042 [Athelia sp. TMB]|nr:hypothetical protein HWV62_37823 [Athelia sp. TMB]KAF7972396.1 hypothetical protein HWV62_18042 [Athelia sp. TMB]
MNTAGLWDSIHFLLLTGTIEQDELGAKVWLARAGGHGWPLTLKLGPDASVGYCVHFPPGASTIIKNLLPHSHRWKQLYCVLSWELFRLFSVVRSQLPSLEKLYIKLTGIPRIPKESHDAFECAPRLASLTLMWACNFKLPWNDLKRLEISPHENCSSATLRDILRECSSLTHLKLWQIEDKAPVDQAPLLLLHLTSIYLQITSDSLFFLDNLMLPALCDITLDVIYTSQIWAHSGKFMLLLERSQGTINSITLGCTHLWLISEDDLLSCLRVLPELRELRILDGAASALAIGSVLHYLTQGDDDGTLIAPKLQFLRVPWTRSFFLDQPFATMLESRWRSRVCTGDNTAHTGLQAVHVDVIYLHDHLESPFEPNCIPATMSTLFRCWKEGMDVRVTGYYLMGMIKDWFKDWISEQEIKSNEPTM